MTILDMLDKYRMPLYSPETGGGTPSGAGGEAGGTPTGGDSPGGGSPAPTGGIADGGADTSFILADEVMNNSDLDSIELPSDVSEPGAPTPVEGAPQTPADPSAAPVVDPSKTPAAPTEQAADPTKTAAPQVEARPASTGTPATPAGQQPLSPQAMLNQMLQNRDALVTTLAEKRFGLSPADAEAMEKDALGHIPKLLARTYFDAYTSAVNFVNQQVPSMIQSHLTEAKADSDAESAFYREFPGLDPTKHGSDVQQYAVAFRQMNPKASLEDAIKFTGAAVAARHGIGNPKQAPSTSGNGARAASPRRTPPFAPAGGTRTVVSTPVESANPFEGIGLQLDD